ncbi:MAG: TonB-dependent receptor [Thermomonas sp.]
MKSSKKNVRRLNRSLLCCALASCLLVGSPQVFAQSANATLRGQVIAGASPVANAEVVATNVATGAVRRTSTGADGSYSLVGLAPGTYTVQAGSAAPRTVTLSVASTATLDLGDGASSSAPEGTITNLDGVTVVGQMLKEVKTSEVGDIISQRQIQTIPQSSRNFLEFADTIPGIVFTDDGNGRTSLRGGGQNASSTNVYIDGVGQKSYVKEGGVAGQFATQGNPFPQLAIGEYKVITSNYKAEYGQISSAAITAVTKSGTNDFHGDVFYRYTDADLRTRRPSEAGRDKVNSTVREYGFALGGPIIRDRMHFFMTYEAKRFGIPTVVTPGVSGFEQFLPSGVSAEFGNESKDFSEDLFFGKIDWQLGDNDSIEFSAKIRDETQEDGIGGSNARSHGIASDNYDRRYALRWEHSTDNWFNEVLLTHEDSFNNPVTLTYGPGSIYTVPTINDAQLAATGGASPLSAQRKGQKGYSIEDNLTFDNFTWHGDHIIKIGARYKAIDLSAADALDINPQFSYDVRTTGTSSTPWKAFFTKPVTGLGGLAPSVTSAAKQYGVFIQDDWSVNDHLTLNLGVRWDYEKNPAYLDFVTPANVVAALNKPDPNAPGQTYAQSLAKGGIDIDDYISTGNNRSAFDGAWQPRLGFSYDLNADEQLVFHGGIGRSYDRDLYDYLQLEVTKTALPQFTVYFKDPGTGLCRGNPCFAYNPNYQTDLGSLQGLVSAGNGGEVDLLNNNLESPYSDQFSLGIASTLGEWQTDATVTRILSYNGFAFTLGNRYPNGDFFQNGGQPWGNGVPGFGALIIGNNGIETKTSQLLLSAQKAYTRESGWGASLAYTFTQARHNRDVTQHYAFDGATIGDYPFIFSNAAPRHRFVASGSYDALWGITLGAKLTLATPTPFNDVVCGPPSQPGEGYCVPAGATVPGNARFGFGGKVFGYRDIDLQATKDFKIGEMATVYARVDLLNAFNFKNYSGYQVNNSKPNLNVVYNTNGDITYYPRTLKLEVGVRF